MLSIQRIWSGPGWFGTRRSVLIRLPANEAPEIDGDLSALLCDGRFRGRDLPTTATVVRALADAETASIAGAA